MKLDEIKKGILLSIGWVPVAFYVIYLKKTFIENKYFQLLFEFSSKHETPFINDYLFIYKDDLLLNFIFIPILICLARVFLKTRILEYLLGFFSIVTLLFLYVNQHSWGTVGQYLTMTAAIDAFTFGLQNPEFIRMYVDNDSIAKISVLVFSVVFILSLVRLIEKKQIIFDLMVSCFSTVYIIAIIFTIVGFSSSMQNAPITQGFLQSAVKVLSSQTWSYNGISQEISNKELVKEFWSHTKLDKAVKNTGYFSKARNNDLIVFVLETGSANFIDLKDDLDSFPTLKKLEKNSIIALNHHSTFPASSESLFSFFSSIYPPRNFYTTCAVSAEIKFKEPFSGFISSFESRGYETALYLPYNDVVPLDHALHQNLGFEKIYFAQSDYTNKYKNQDIKALSEMKRDITSWIDSDKRYVTTFLPQIGHAPWAKKPNSVSVKEYGRDIAIEQDKWLGEIVELLENKGRLDSTTIVLTGDHGIRTAIEDPSFRTGFIGQYSFHVPLLIYSKAGFEKTVWVEDLSSHIDVSPTIRALHGYNENSHVEQGVPLLSKQISKRNVYFLGNWYFGADGFYNDGDYLMYSDILDVAFLNEKLFFNTSDFIKNLEDKNIIRDKVRRLYAIQEKWVERFLCNIPE